MKTVLQNAYNKTQPILTKLFSYFQDAGLDFCPLYVIYFVSLVFCILSHKAKLYWDSWKI